MELAQACPIKAGSYYYLHKKISKQDVGMAQYMNALADKVLKQEVPCTQWYAHVAYVGMVVE